MQRSVPGSTLGDKLVQREHLWNKATSGCSRSSSGAAVGLILLVVVAAAVLVMTVRAAQEAMEARGASRRGRPM